LIIGSYTNIGWDYQYLKTGSYNEAEYKRHESAWLAKLGIPFYSIAGEESVGARGYGSTLQAYSPRICSPCGTCEDFLIPTSNGGIVEKTYTRNMCNVDVEVTLTTNKIQFSDVGMSGMYGYTTEYRNFVTITYNIPAGFY